MIKKYKGYKIDIEVVPHNGFYHLTTMVGRHKEHFLADTIDDYVFDKFIDMVERDNK